MKLRLELFEDMLARGILPNRQASLDLCLFDLALMPMPEIFNLLVLAYGGLLSACWVLTGSALAGSATPANRAIPAHHQLASFCPSSSPDRRAEVRRIMVPCKTSPISTWFTPLCCQGALIDCG